MDHPITLTDINAAKETERKRREAHAASLARLQVGCLERCRRELLSKLAQASNPVDRYIVYFKEGGVLSGEEEARIQKAVRDILVDELNTAVPGVARADNHCAVVVNTVLIQ